MEISKVSLEDGRMCAQLVALLSKGKWDLSMADAEIVVSTRKWLVDLARQMASQLKSKEEAPPKPEGPAMKVKTMGALPTSSKKKTKAKVRK